MCVLCLCAALTVFIAEQVGHSCKPHSDSVELTHVYCGRAGHEEWSQTKADHERLMRGESDNRQDLLAPFGALEDAADETSEEDMVGSGGGWVPEVSDSSGSMQTLTESREQVETDPMLVPESDSARCAVTVGEGVLGHRSLIDADRRAAAHGSRPALASQDADVLERQQPHLQISAEHQDTADDAAQLISHHQQQHHDPPSTRQHAVGMHHEASTEPSRGAQERRAGIGSYLSLSSDSPQGFLFGNEAQVDDSRHSVTKAPMDYEQALRHAQNIYGTDCRLVSASAGA